MLAVQDITLTWGKDERGGRNAATRARFFRSYAEAPVPAHYAAAVFMRAFFQDRDELSDAARRLRVRGALDGETLEKRIRRMKRLRVSLYASLDDIKATGLSVERFGDSYSICFFWDESRCGMPVRRGSNKDYNNRESPLCGKDVLNERAFILSAEQYGRIVWNERLRDADTGGWFYRLHIYNLFHAPRTFAGLEFVSRKPDFLYEQLAHLN